MECTLFIRPSSHSPRGFPRYCPFSLVGGPQCLPQGKKSTTAPTNGAENNEKHHSKHRFTSEADSPHYQAVKKLIRPIIKIIFLLADFIACFSFEIIPTMAISHTQSKALQRSRITLPTKPMVTALRIFSLSSTPYRAAGLSSK